MATPTRSPRSDDDELQDQHRPRTWDDVQNEHRIPNGQELYDREFAGIAGNYGATADHPHGDKEGKATGADKLKDGEEAPDRSGFSAGDSIKEKLGKGYTGKGSQKSKFLSKLYSSDSKLKKRIGIAGALAGGGVAGGALLFFAMLPLKIEHVIQNVEGHYGASSNSALDNETTNLFDNYIVKKVFPNLGKGKCHSTIDASCVALSSSGNSPVSSLFNAWKQGRLENKMASKYNLAFGKKNGRYYMNLNASTIDLGKGESIFGAPGTKSATVQEIRSAVRDSLKEATLYDKVYTRFKLYSLLQTKYGIRRCVTTIGCSLSDKFHDSLGQKKFAAKGYIIEKVVSPISQEYGLVLQCIIGGGSVCDNTSPSDNSSVDESGDEEKLSGFQQNLQQQLDQFASQEGDEALSKVLGDANKISEKGLMTYIFEKAAEQLGFDVGENEALNSAIPVIGWINFAAKTIGQLNNIGPKLKALNYAIAAAGAVKLYMSYRNIADEAKSGHIDAAELGSFSSTLSDDTNLDGNGNDMADSPLYNNLMGGGVTNSASIFSDIFGGIASADAAPTTGPGSERTYTCNNGQTPPSGKMVCDEEHLDGGNSVANAITNVEHDVPGWGALVTAATAWNDTIGKLYNLVGGASSWIISHLPGIGSLQNLIGKLITPLVTAVAQFLLPSPFSTNMSGGRSFDMIAAGSDVSENESCQVQLGCAKISDAQVAQMQNEQLAEQKQAFDSMPMFARLFNTSTPNSLISRFALDMPTSWATATNDGVASLVTNPFSRLADAFGSLFSVGGTAFAAQTAQPDPFGVVQTGYPSEPSDPETFWDQNCVSGPLATYDASTQTLDVSNWLNNQQVDPNTGEAVATTTNPCLLIQSSVQSAGGMFNDKLLPPGSGSNDQTDQTTSTTSTTIPTGSAEQLAKQILNSPNLSFQTPEEKTYFQQIVNTGHQTQCGDPAISPKLLGVILAASQQYKLVLGVFDDGHGCGDGLHDHGIAVDLNGITPLDGSYPGTGNTIDWSAKEQPLLAKFDGYMGNLLGNNGGGGMGQKECFTSTSAPSVPSNVTFFSDTCTHQHIDVR